jgi:hypothetical protein
VTPRRGSIPLCLAHVPILQSSLQPFVSLNYRINGYLFKIWQSKLTIFFLNYNFWSCHRSLARLIRKQIKNLFIVHFEIAQCQVSTRVGLVNCVKKPRKNTSIFILMEIDQGILELGFTWLASNDCKSLTSPSLSIGEYRGTVASYKLCHNILFFRLLNNWSEDLLLILSLLTNLVKFKRHGLVASAQINFLAVYLYHLRWLLL